MKRVSSINAGEVAKFEKLANEWWDAEVSSNHFIC